MVLSLLEDVIEALEGEFARDTNNRALVENSFLEDLGRSLAARIGRSRPFSHRYLKSILNKTLSPPKTDSDLGRALEALAMETDGIPDKLAGAVKISVFAPSYLSEEITGALITQAPVKCARPACFVYFIRNAPNQKYHSNACRLLHYKEKRNQ